MSREMLCRMCWLGVAVLAGGCGSDSLSSRSDTTTRSQSNGPGQYPYTLVTTCGMVGDIVRVVAGEYGEVTGLMGEGVDPHLYKPTRNDVQRLMDGDLVFYSGLMLEGRMTDTFAKVARQGKLVFPVTEEIEESYLLEPPEFDGHWDPHVWMDVGAWSQCVGVVAKALAEFDPQHAANYAANQQAYQAELKELDSYIRKVIATIPEEQRVLVTAHDAFGYFSRAYGIEVRAVQGLSTESGAGLKDIEDLVQFIVKRQIQAIFVETSVSQKNIQALIEGASEQGWTVKIGGELFSDAMGKPGTYRGTYIGMMDHNATTIARALGGSAPKSGWRGKLASGAD